MGMDKISETKQKLLEAALSVFSEKGYERAKVSDIVAMAEVAQGTFYIHFKSKKDCLNELSINLIGNYLDDIEKEAAQMNELSIHRLAGIMLDTINNHKEVISIFHFEQGNLNEEVSRLHQEAHRKTLETIKRSFMAAGYSDEKAEIKSNLLDAVFA